MAKAKTEACDCVDLTTGEVVHLVPVEGRHLPMTKTDAKKARKMARHKRLQIARESVAAAKAKARAKKDQ